MAAGFALHKWKFLPGFKTTFGATVRITSTASVIVARAARPGNEGAALDLNGLHLYDLRLYIAAG